MSAAADALEQLEADHRLMLQLFAEYAALARRAAARGKRRTLARHICIELEIHSRLEEELLYPVARAALRDDDLFDACEQEHESARDLLSQVLALRPRDDALYDARMAVLRSYVKRHLRVENSRIFPRLRAATLDLRALGKRMAVRRAELHAVSDALVEEAISFAS